MSRNLCIGDPPKNPFGIHQLPCLPSISCGGSWYALVTENIVMKTSRSRELPPEVLNVGILVNDVFELDMISLSRAAYLAREQERQLCYDVSIRSLTNRDWVKSRRQGHGGV